MSDDDDLALDGVFTEPPAPPKPEATFSTYTRELVNAADQNGWREIKIRLVGAHPLWGHYLWNAARAFASYLDSHSQLYRDRTVIELGAGGGLPSIVTALSGARKTVVTDYPDADLLENMIYNINSNLSEIQRRSVDVQGYIWGRPVDPLLDAIAGDPNLQGSRFDLIILSDLIFNHSQHEALLKTCELVLSKQASSPTSQSASTQFVPSVLVFYTHHRPHLAHKDMEFFSKAHDRGWSCEEILTKEFPPMFPQDSGEESVRSTVHGWRLVRSS